MKIALINFHSLVLDNPWIKEKAISINYLKVELETRTRNFRGKYWGKSKYSAD